MNWKFWRQPTTNAELVTYDVVEPSHSMLGHVLNVISSLRRDSGVKYGISPDGKRNYNELYGYGDCLDYNDYYGMYKRGGIANAVVGKVARACWRDVPELTVDDSQVLETEIAQLKNAGFFRALERADILNRIGQFSVLVLGVPDGSDDLEEPLGSAGAAAFEDMWFNPYSFDGTEIVEWDMDATSKRFGLPQVYEVQPDKNDTTQTKDINTRAWRVHWTRVIHMAEGALDSSIEGTSALEPIWNALQDKDKTRGGASESYYRNARQKLALEVDKDATIDRSTEALEKLKQHVEDFQNGLEDVLRLDKMKANMLQPGMVSPKDSYDIAIEEISGQTGIPIRILTGKGGGQTTGEEDKASWNALIADRQEQICSLWLLRGLAIMEEAGMLTVPENVEITWPVQGALNENSEATALQARANALSTVMNGLVNTKADPKTVNAVLKLVGFQDVDALVLELKEKQSSETGDQNTPDNQSTESGEQNPEDDKTVDEE